MGTDQKKGQKLKAEGKTTDGHGSRHGGTDSTRTRPLAESILEKERPIAEIVGNVKGLPGSNQMNELIFLIEEAAEGGYTARALGHSISGLSP
jgi:hypothetical protein